MACLREPWPSAWMLNQNTFAQDPVHLWMPTGRKKLTHLFWSFQKIFVRLMAFFLLYFFTSPSVNKLDIQTLIRWLFWDISLPSSLSAGFLNKVIFLASTSHLLVNWLLRGKQSELGLDNKCIKVSTLKNYWSVWNLYLVNTLNPPPL